MRALVSSCKPSFRSGISCIALTAESNSMSFPSSVSESPSPRESADGICV